MFAVMMCLLVQGSDKFDANAYYDNQYKIQCDKAKQHIDKIKSSPRSNIPVNVNSATAKYNNIKVGYNIDLPDFNFNDGVKEGDIASFGHDKARSGRIPTGTGGTIQGYSKTQLLTKVGSINNNSFETNLRGYGATIINGFDKSQLIEEKMVNVTDYLLRYDGKQSNAKSYTVVATPADLAKWKKDRTKKK